MEQDYYMVWYTRSPPYVVGILVGYIMYQLRGKELKMNWVLQI